MLYWDESLATGVQVIDDDHKNLFGLINNLQTATENLDESWRVPMAVDALNDYAQDHFQREEALMLLCGYTALPRHQEEHAKFKSVVADLRSLYGTCPELVSLQGLNQFLISWLTDHIAVNDHSYIPQMRASKELIDAASANLIKATSLGIEL